MNFPVLQIVPFMMTITHFLLKQLLFSAITFAIIFLWIIIAKKRISIFLQYGLWILFWLRLLLPPDYGLPISLRQIISNVTGWRSEHGSYSIFNASASRRSYQDFSGTSSNDSEFQPEIFQLLEIIFFLSWITGVSIFSSLYLKSRRHYHTIIATAEENTDDDLNHMMEKWKKRFRIKRPVKLLIAETKHSPFAAGIFVPGIIVPKTLIDIKHLHLLEAAIAHEMAHIRLYDTVWIKLHAVLKIVYFFHPAVWIAHRHFSLIREMIADTLVVHMNGFSRDHYYQSMINLIKINQFTTEVDMKPAFVSHKNSIRKRLVHIYDNQPVSYRKLLSITLLIIIFSVLVLPMHLLSDNDGQNQFSDKIVLNSKTDRVNTIHIINPLRNAKLTLEYGKVSHPITGKEYVHQGVDLAQKIGTPIQSAADGTVITVNQMEKLEKGYGNHLIIRHDGFQTQYAHMDSVYVKVGQFVQQGETVGTVGNSGVSTGPHLHFELRIEGKCVNPQDYIDF